MTKKQNDKLAGLDAPSSLPGWNTKQDPDFSELEADIGDVIKHADVSPGLKAMAAANKGRPMVIQTFNGDSIEEAQAKSDAYHGIKPPRTQTPRKRVRRGEKIDTREYTGGPTSYYEINIEHPHKAKRSPYMAECLDIIEALGMSFAEGEAFKALWRMCAARQGKSKKGYNDQKYDAEKVAFYGQRILDDVVTPKGKKA
jgi:hypothetical protein